VSLETFAGASEPDQAADPELSASAGDDPISAAHMKPACVRARRPRPCADHHWLDDLGDSLGSEPLAAGWLQVDLVDLCRSAWLPEWLPTRSVSSTN
jgi:hypothetical protein